MQITIRHNMRKRGATANLRTQREARDAGAAQVPAFHKVALHCTFTITKNVKFYLPGNLY